MGKILTTDIKYENNKLYYCKKNNKGLVEVFETIRTTGRKKGQKNKKEDMYF